MEIYPEPIKSLIEYFSTLPGVGKRAGTRHVFHLLQEDDIELEDFAQKLSVLKEKITLCERCFNVAKDKNGSDKNLCEICKDEKRERNKIMVVEKISDIESLEEAGAYQGLYHVLGSTLPVKNKNKEKSAGSQSLEKLQKRIKKKTKAGKEVEIIIGLNPTKEGELSSQYLAKKIKSLPRAESVSLSRLGKGLPTGGEMAYADKSTLKEALKRRSDV